MKCFINNEMDQITDNVWLGNYEAANNIDNLKKEGIKKILCVMDFSTPVYKEEDKFIQKIVKIVDVPTQNILKYLGECLKFIKGDEKILVHCMAGASRSASIVIAYIMWEKKMPYHEALKFVGDKRSSVFPNFGFRDQLKKFEQLLKDNDYDIEKIDFSNIEWKVDLSKYW